MAEDRHDNPSIRVSPGVRKLLNQCLIEEIGRIHSQRPYLLPSLFDMDRGRGYQKVTHVCLLPWHWRVHRIPCPSPVYDLRLVLHREGDGSLLLRLRNRGLEESLASGDRGCVQGELFTDTENKKDLSIGDETEHDQN